LGFQQMWYKIFYTFYLKRRLENGGIRFVYCFCNRVNF
jgi:hypothetical protein